MSYLNEVLAARELLANLTMREIRGKYSRTVFGQLWSLVNPLVLMLIYTLVFGFILKVQPAPGNPSGLDVFALWLLCALLPWTFFATVLTQTVGSLVTHANLIQKVYFTRIVLPLSVVGSSAYTWLFEMFILLVALTIGGARVLPWLPLLVLQMLLLALFAAGLALMAAIANVYFRDTQYIVGLLLQLWLYLTPIIYPLSLVTKQSDQVGPVLGTTVTIADIYSLNPMVHFVGIFRNLLYDNRAPEVAEWLICTAWAFASIVVGALIFRRNEMRLAELL